ncbi:uncharacterized protein BDW47DRAFT_44769 [Aspergillus candidus]|uniref:Uncharacterized protein n=1 Tax=Aspergillus candidus TaxID=41067 RepID=A0A2I2F8Q8_ASPCN|nr:hypothetical protein BDW47DRAFT_44769 [Aspergillus candidus]PLB37010.1 hypothetical protein BDW47DRAFT_44769 [Aspergillus candidus]
MGFQRSSSMFLHWNPGHLLLCSFSFLLPSFLTFIVRVLLPLAAPLGEARPLSLPYPFF